MALGSTADDSRWAKLADAKRIDDHDHDHGIKLSDFEMDLSESGR